MHMRLLAHVCCHFITLPKTSFFLRHTFFFLTHFFDGTIFPPNPFFEGF